MNDPTALAPLDTPAPTLTSLITAEVRAQLTPQLAHALDELQTGLGQHVASVAQQAVAAAVDPLTTGHAANAQAVESVKADVADLSDGLMKLVPTVGSLVASQAPGVVAIKGSLNTAGHDLVVVRMVVGGAVAFILLFSGFYFAGSHVAADTVVLVGPALLTIAGIAGRMLLAAATGTPPVAKP